MRIGPVRPWHALLAACALVYLVLASTLWARQVWNARHARDFASYYYAVQVAWEGGDPYDTSLLDQKARADHTRAEVFPYFYPPPFLLAFAWVVPLSLQTAYRSWYVLDHGLLLAIILALWRWIGRREALLGLAVMAVTYTPLPDNDWMGQVNLLVLALTVVGLLLAERDRPRVGGALVGIACMLKMSPALLVAWWLLQRRLTPALWACLAGLAISLATLPLVGGAVQWRFYTEVLPGFGAGDYHGLTVPILLEANHSIPSLFAELFPGGRTTLSPVATGLSRVTALLLLAALGWRFRKAARDALESLCQVGAVIVVMLILPVYTYEHHTVWLLVPYTAALAALVEGRLGRPWTPFLALAYTAQAVPLIWMKKLYAALDALGPLEHPIYLVLREGKFLAALLVGIACVAACRKIDSLDVAARTPPEATG